MAKSFYRDIRNLKSKYKYWTHIIGCAKEKSLDYLIDYDIESDDNEDNEETDEKTSNNEEIDDEDENKSYDEYEFNFREIKKIISNVFFIIFCHFYVRFNALFNNYTFLYISLKISNQFRLVQ
jgi:hypothetical protein